MRTSPGWQPATKQGLQSDSHKKLERTSATVVHAVCPINTVDSARRDPEQRTQPCCTQSPDQIHINCVLFSHKWMFFLSHSMCSTLLCRKRKLIQAFRHQKAGHSHQEKALYFALTLCRMFQVFCCKESLRWLFLALMDFAVFGIQCTS